MQFQISPIKTIDIDEELVDFLKQQKEDFRICTSCFGAELLPVSVKRPKISDFKVRIGKNILYISRVQARYIKRVDKSMLRHTDLAEIERCFMKK